MKFCEAVDAFGVRSRWPMQSCLGKNKKYEPKTLLWYITFFLLPPRGTKAFFKKEQKHTGFLHFAQMNCVLPCCSYEGNMLFFVCLFFFLSGKTNHVKTFLSPVYLLYLVYCRIDDEAGKYFFSYIFFFIGHKVNGQLALFSVSPLQFKLHSNGAIGDEWGPSRTKEVYGLVCWFVLEIF